MLTLKIIIGYVPMRVLLIKKAGIATCSDCEVYFIPGDNGLTVPVSSTNIMLGVIAKKTVSNPVLNLLSQLMKKPQN
jgi:hypothetical protein